MYWLLFVVLAASAGLAFLSPVFPSLPSGQRLGRGACSTLSAIWDHRGALLLPAALTTIGLAAAFSFNLFQQPSNEVELPIEVIGPDGHTVGVQVNASEVGDVDRLYLKAHSIGYPYHLAEGRGYEVDKASIRLNGGSWVDVNNRTATCLEPAASARCIDGPMHTIELTLPISELGSLDSGANMVEFRFNYAHPDGELGDVSTGYRILDLELQTSGGADRIDGTTFSWDDPGSWTAPDGFDSDTDRAEGEKLWHQRDALVDGWAGPEITASCADCHEKEGYDLQYFGYSNTSIVERARFHGLSENEGKQIAAYIRAIQIETEGGREIDPPGRPWHPPYQPGPTAVGSRAEQAPREKGQPFSELDPVYWAAGAGSQWAMTYDRNVKPHVFPDGLGSAATDNLINETINLREIPIALQMPDWNEWLPAVHPMDVWGSDFTDHEAWRWYTEEVPDEVQKAVNQDDPQKAGFAAKQIWANLMEGGDKFRPNSAPAPFDSDTDEGVATLSRMQWGLTKTFEILHTNRFENDAKQVYGSAAEDLQWLSDSRIIFDQAPHIQGTVKGSRSGIMDRYHDASWYQLQAIVNAGSGITTDQKPVDWKYHWGHVSAVNEPDAHTWQYLASYVKILQVAEDLPADYDPWSDNHPEGWYLRHLTPGVLDRSHHWAEPLRPKSDGGLTEEEYRKVLNVLLRALGTGMTPEPLSEWSRLENDQYGIEPESAVPEMTYSYDCCTYADHFWSVLKRAGEAGAAYEVLEPLAQWAGDAWPNGDWMGHIEPYKDNPPFDETTNATPTVELTAPSDGSTFSSSESVSLEASASDSDGTVAKVEFFAADSSLGTSSSSPHTHTTSDLPAGHHSITAVASDDEGATTTSAPITVSVKRADGTLPPRPGVAREYYEGDWTQIPDYDAMTPLSRDTTANFSIASPAQEDHFGYRLRAYVEVEEEGTHTFYVTSDDGSKMYVNGSLLIDNDGTHGDQEKSGEVTLSPGYHLLVVDYFEATRGQTLDVQWSTPTASKSSIPDSRLYPTKPYTQQTISLQNGWNLVSSRIRPDDPSMHSVYEGLVDEMVLTKADDGRLFSPRYDATTLDTWSPKEGYQVYMTTDTSVTIEGQPVAPDAPLPLKKGWNFVPYLPTETMPTEDAFAALGDALVIVKDYAGNAYIPGETNEIAEVRPTQGYEIYVTQADTLRYPSSSQTSSSSTSRRKTANAQTGRPNTATLLVNAPTLPEDTPVSVLANGRVVGTDVVRDGTAAITVRGTDRFSSADTPTADEGATLTLASEREDSRTSLQIREAENLLTGASVGSPLTYTEDAVFVASVAQEQNEFGLSKNVPNPARTTATIRYTLPTTTDVTLTLYNVLGQEVATLVDGSKSPGQHQVQMDASELSSGVYFYRINAGSYTKSRKMTVVQ